MTRQPPLPGPPGKPIRFSLAILLLIPSLLSADPGPAPGLIPGESYFGQNRFIEYRAGNLPIILVTGHDGSLRPESIPDRTYGVTGRDTSSQPLTLDMAAELFRRTGKHPHLIINHLHRRKLDPNREIIEAAQGNPLAEQAWHDFHSFIETARKSAATEFGFGILFDIHGHAHDIKRLELGYGLAANILNLSNKTLEKPGYGWNSTLRNLITRRPDLSFPELLRGPESLGSLFNHFDIPAWPSNEFPSPGDAPFFSGGYIVRTHSSLTDNGPISAIQIETPGPGVRDTAINRKRFAHYFAQIMQPFIYYNFGHSIGSAPLYSLKTDTTDTVFNQPVTIEILRTGFTTYNDEIEISVSGGREGINYTIDKTKVPFDAGQTSATVTFTPILSSGSNREWIATFSLRPTPVQAADPSPLHITAGNPASAGIHFPFTEITLPENTGQISIPILRRRPVNWDQNVTLTWTGDAIPGADYNLPSELPKSVTFPAGATKTEIPVRIIDDNIPEPDKTIHLRLNPNSSLIGLPSEIKIKIADDDRPSQLAVWLRGDTSGSFFTDYSGNNRHAAAIRAGRDPEIIPSPNGPSIQFDGSTAAALPPFDLDTSDGYTIAFRIRINPQISTPRHTILSYGPHGSDGSLNIYLNNQNTLRTEFSERPASIHDLNATWLDGNWRHYAISVAADGTKTVYMNGAPVRSRSNGTVDLHPNQTFWLGWLPGPAGANQFLGGSINDFRIYERSLNPPEILHLATGINSFNAWSESIGLPEGSRPEDNFLNTPLLKAYAFGIDPRKSATLPRYSIETNPETGSIRLHLLRRPNLSDIHWRIESTENLAGNWQIIAEASPENPNWQSAPDISITETGNLLSLRQSFSPAETQRFYRIRAEFIE